MTLAHASKAVKIDYNLSFIKLTVSLYFFCYINTLKSQAPTAIFNKINYRMNNYD